MWRTVHRAALLIVGAACAIATMALAPATPPGWQVTDHARLADMPQAEVAGFLSDHSGLTAAALSSDPGVVAQWWASVPRSEQKSLVARMPDVLGNLAGVDYAARNTANRAQLKLDLAAAAAALAKSPTDVGAIEQDAALRAIAGALGAVERGKRYLVELTSDQPPLAAIAIGNLDTAKQVTFLVPGMGTLTSDMHLWTRAAQNVYDTQTTAGAVKRHAVIAWVGYRTPPPGMEATRDNYATRGALLLTRDITGLRAARGGRAQPTVSVVAHSYGATTAALAIAGADLGIHAFVMLGSAGVDPAISSVADLHADHVYDGEAAADLEARWGRIDRRDPGNPAFGATALAVNGNAAKGLLGVTGHEPIIHSPWNDEPGCPLWSAPEVGSDLYQIHMASYGYLDAGTQSLLNVGAVTTPPVVRGFALGARPKGHQGPTKNEGDPVSTGSPSGTSSGYSAFTSSGMPGPNVVDTVPFVM
jgi:pimeloyl-ACP methyl ester carboxylesterase